MAEQDLADGLANLATPSSVSNVQTNTRIMTESDIEERI